MSEEIFDTDFEPGQDNVRLFGLDLHNPVFFISSLLVLLFVTGSIMFPDTANAWLTATKDVVINNFDWLFMIAGNFFVIFCLGLALSPAGKIRLGGADAEPEFGLFSWFAMLFAAGMGIGLMFWSVAEPVAYYTDWYGTPLDVKPNTEKAASMAMGAVMYHWGLHPWAIYAVVGLALAYFAYNHDMPLTIRSAFYPLLGERCWGWPGHIIDTLAVLATIVGLATSLGLGAKQAAGGLEFLFGIENGLNVQIAVITGVTGVAVISVVRGMDGGVKLLSNINMGLALLLFLFVAVLGAGFGLFADAAGTAGAYVANLLPLSNWMGREDETWLHG
jgi:BCCT family betaine/carnitine transporter